MRRVLVAAAAASLLLLAGCNDGLQVAPPTSEAGVIGPVIITEDQSSATAEVGRILYFSVAQPIGTTLSTSDPAILDITQAGVEGDMVTAPTARALKTGTATITVIAPDGSARDVSVTITD